MPRPWEERDRLLVEAHAAIGRGKHEDARRLLGDVLAKHPGDDYARDVLRDLEQRIAERAGRKPAPRVRPRPAAERLAVGPLPPDTPRGVKAISVLYGLIALGFTAYGVTGLLEFSAKGLLAGLIGFPVAWGAYQVAYGLWDLERWAWFVALGMGVVGVGAVYVTEPARAPWALGVFVLVVAYLAVRRSRFGVGAAPATT